MSARQRSKIFGSITGALRAVLESISLFYQQVEVELQLKGTCVGGSHGGSKNLNQDV